MIPWFFATNRVNYSRHASSHWMVTMCLEQTNPCMYRLHFVGAIELICCRYTIVLYLILIF